MAQTRPVSGFEGFPGTDPGHHSSRWGKCYQNMSLCFYFFILFLVAGLQQPQREGRALSNWVLWLTSRLKCRESPDLTLQQKHQCCFPCLESDFGWRCCLCPVWIPVRLCPLPAGTFPPEGAPLQCPVGVCGESDWDSVPSAPGAGESGEDGLGGALRAFIPWRKQPWMVGSWWALC